MPLPTAKRCHRCKVLGIDCVVWDGDRKRKPRLDARSESTPRSFGEQDVSSPPEDRQAKAPRDAPTILASDTQRNGMATRESASIHGHHRGDSGGSSAPVRNTEAEQLRASDLRYAQQMLINRHKSWKAMSRTLHALMERLQQDRGYSNYLKLRIDAPPSTPDMAAFLPLDRAKQLEVELQDYLVEHPYLPSLVLLQQEQACDATTPRALLLATMTLLGLKGTHDPLVSPDIRILSSYIDRLGTQLLFSAPRDIHLVMAFELLLAHEPGLVGTAASQFEPEGRGFGLASENLLTCAIKVAKELRLNETLPMSQPTPDKLAQLSLWCCLRSWEGVYAFLGETITMLDDLDPSFADHVRQALFCIDDNGKKLPSPPRLRDATGSTAHSFQEMREFCAQSEKRLGRDGILRSAGRTVLCMRIEAVCCLFDSLRKLRETLSNAGVSLETKQQRISDVTRKAYDKIMNVRHMSNEHLGEQRRVVHWRPRIGRFCTDLQPLIHSVAKQVSTQGSGSFVCGSRWYTSNALSSAVSMGAMLRRLSSQANSTDRLSHMSCCVLSASGLVLPNASVRWASSPRKSATRCSPLFRRWTVSLHWADSLASRIRPHRAICIGFRRCSCVR